MGAILLVAASLAVAVAAQEGSSPAQKVSAGTSYLIIATQRTSAMAKELSEASAAGYRVVVASDTGDTEKALLLEKSADPQPTEYGLIAAREPATLEKELNAAAAQGFRLLPRAVIPNLVLMEKAPRAATTGSEYLVVSFPTRYATEADILSMKIRVTGRLNTRRADLMLAEAASAGFRVVSLFTRKVEEREEEETPLGGKREMRLELIVLFERKREPDDREQREAQREAAKRYQVMTAVGSETEFEEVLNRAAEAGYHLLAVSPMGFPEMVAIVERNPPGAELYSYRVLMTRRTSTLAKELAGVAAAGWLPHPRGLLDGAGEIVLVTEKTGGSVVDSEYLLLVEIRTSRLAKELTQAAEAGFQLLTAGSAQGKLMLVLKRARPRPGTPQ